MRLGPVAVKARGSYQDTYAAFGPPRSGKSNWMAQVGLDAPGACMFTSTRADLTRDTAKARARRGPVHFINPGGDGGFPSNLRWSPVTGCQDPRAAMRAAGAIIHAAPRDPSGKDAWWDHQSKTLLQMLLHAAALIPGATIWDVRRWASGVDLHSDDTTLRALATPAAAGGWAGEFARLCGRVAEDPQYGSGVSSGILTALAWLDDPALTDLACPVPGEEFDVRQLIRDRGSVYLIGADDAHNPLSPYFACFATSLWNAAKAMAADPEEEASRDLQLNPELTMIIDEPLITCPVPLDRWATEAGGHGITLITGFQSDAQLPKRFGEHGGRALEDIFTVKMVFGGVTGAIAQKASGWAGPRDTWHGSKDNLSTEPAFPAERICNLPLGRAFVKHRNPRCFIAEIGRVQDHPLYERASGADFRPAEPQRLALDPPRHEAIPMPGGTPRPVTAPDAVPALTREEDTTCV